jgi:hypothetical protein
MFKRSRWNDLGVLSTYGKRRVRAIRRRTFTSFDSVLLFRLDRQNGYEVQSEGEILVQRQRKESEMAKNHPNSKYDQYSPFPMGQREDTALL